MKKAILFYHCLTPLHNGAGSDIGLIDRPIIRERTTKLPFVQATSVKGVLRAEATAVDKGKARLAFGDDDAKGSKHQGFADVDDAGMLALPIRSLKGGFVWATTDLLLMRLQRAVSEVGGSLAGLDQAIEAAAKLKEGQILVTPAAQPKLEVSMGDKKMVFLEEYGYQATASQPLEQLAQALAPLAIGEPSFRDAFAERLCLLPRDSLLYFAQFATELQANIKIDADSGTTTGGSLRYTEYLPQEAMLMGRLATRDVTYRNGSNALSTAGDVFDFVAGIIDDNPHRFGADQTTGKGITHVRRYSGQEEA